MLRKALFSCLGLPIKLKHETGPLRPGREVVDSPQTNSWSQPRLTVSGTSLLFACALSVAASPLKTTGGRLRAPEHPHGPQRTLCRRTLLREGESAALGVGGRMSGPAAPPRGGWGKRAPELAWMGLRQGWVSSAVWPDQLPTPVDIYHRRDKRTGFRVQLCWHPQDPKRLLHFVPLIF